MNSAEALADNHIVEQLPECFICRPDPMELLTIDAYMPPDSNEDNEMYQFMDNYDKWDKSLNTVGVNDTGSSHTFTSDNTSDSTDEYIKSDFWIEERQS